MRSIKINVEKILSIIVISKEQNKQYIHKK